MPKYRVTMCRIGYGFKVFEIEARTRFEAEKKAYEMAPNHQYLEHKSEYEMESIVKTRDK